MPEKPLLFTFRSAKEGGEQAISTEAYIALNRAAIDSGPVDMIDLELFTGDDQVKETVAYAHAHDVKVVMSNHDFHKKRRKPKKSLPVCANAVLRRRYS